MGLLGVAVGLTIGGALATGVGGLCFDKYLKDQEKEEMKGYIDEKMNGEEEDSDNEQQ